MVAKNLIDDVLALPTKDRIDLLRRLWESVRNDANDLPLSNEEKRELDRRYDEFLQNPLEGSSWEEVEAFVQSKLRT